MINPQEFNVNIPVNSAFTDTLNMQNTGGQDLIYDISVTYQGDNTGWISLSQSSGIIEPNQENNVSVSFYSLSLPEGTYNATINISDNRETTEIPVTLNVQNVETNEDIINVSNLDFKNYPNPFNPSTTISFNLKREAFVSLTVYNIKGEFVNTLISKKLTQGSNQVVWNGLDKYNRTVKSGIYLFKLKIDKKEFYKKSVLLK